MKIYRLEIWISVDHKYKWGYHPLSDFHTDKRILEKAQKEYIDIFNEFNSDPDEMKTEEKWSSFISKIINESVFDTRYNLPEIKEYTLNVD